MRSLDGLPVLGPVYTDLKKESKLVLQNHLGSFSNILRPGLHFLDSDSIGLEQGPGIVIFIKSSPR